MKRKPVSLALQGGGALGAFTWGALDRLLQDERIEIAAISGTSAGAMNAVVLAEGFHDGGAEGARQNLKRFWEGVAGAGGANPYRRAPGLDFFTAFLPPWMRESYFSTWADVTSRFASPYDLNPLNINPLRDVLSQRVNFEKVRACESIELFISATNAETGRIRVFSKGELSADHIMASACLPQVFQAVEIDGAPYWDGGYTGNPALFPLFQVQATRDIVIVQLHPMERDGVPRTAPDIIARTNEITFNASLLSELRAIEFVGRLMDQSRLPSDHYRKMLMHIVGQGGPLTPLAVGADLNTDLSFLRNLFERGRSTAEAWLTTNFDALGARSTLDLEALLHTDPSAR